MNFDDEIMDILSKYISPVPQELLSDMEELLNDTYSEGYRDGIYSEKANGEPR